MAQRRRGEGIRSVRVRILASMLVVAALGMTVAGGVAYLVQRERVLGQVEERLAAEVDTLRQVAAGPPDGTPPDSVDQLLRAAIQQIVPGATESSVGIVDGAAAWTPGARGAFELSDDAAFVTRVIAEADAERVVSGTAQTPERLLRYIVVPVAVAGDPSSGLYVAAIDLDAELGQVAESFRSYAIIAAIALVALGLVGWLVAGRALRPLRLLRQTAENASAHDLSDRVPVVGRDEVSELARTLNGMLDRLQGSFTAQRRLLDDVGHELRTPLTIVRGHLELVDPADRDDVAATRDLALDELDRMSALLGDLTLLARTDDPTFLTSSPIEVDALSAAVAAKARALSGEHSWVVQSGARAGALVAGDERRLTEAWLQLAENAAKYSPAGSSIRLGSGSAGARIQLWVDDDGPGIAEADRDRVFQRFARVDSGRGAEGSGLGLAIVLAIAEAHGGTARMEASASGGTRAVIELPSAAATPERGPRPERAPSRMPGSTADAQPTAAQPTAVLPTGVLPAGDQPTARIPASTPPHPAHPDDQPTARIPASTPPPPAHPDDQPTARIPASTPPPHAHPDDQPTERIDGAPHPDR